MVNFKVIESTVPAPTGVKRELMESIDLLNTMMTVAELFFVYPIEVAKEQMKLYCIKAT